MNSYQLVEFAIRSVVLGGLTWLLVVLLPRGVFRRARVFAVYAAWIALATITFGLVVPLPCIEAWRSISAISLARVAQGPAAIPVLTILWLGGTLIILVREMVGVIRLRRIVRDAKPLHDPAWRDELDLCRRALHLPAPIQLRSTDRLGPCAAGWLHPVILLPHSASDWTQEMRSQVLFHELAHFRRRDLWVQMIIRFIAALHWFNPFASALRRHVESERELACDAWVVRYRGDAVAYARCLLTLAAIPMPSGAVPALTLLPRRCSQLELRVRELLAGAVQRSLTGRMLEAVVVVLAFTLLLACSMTGPARSTRGEQWTETEVERRLTADPFPAEP